MMRFLHNRSNSKDSDGQFTWTKNAQCVEVRVPAQCYFPARLLSLTQRYEFCTLPFDGTSRS